MFSDGSFRIRSGSTTSLTEVGYNEELKKDDMLYKEFGGKNRTVESMAGAKYIYNDGERLRYSNFCQGQHKSVVVFNKKENINKFYPRLKNSIVGLKSLQDSLATSINSTEEVMFKQGSELLDKVCTVAQELIELGDLAEQLQINANDLIDIYKVKESYIARDIFKAVNKALIGAVSLESVMEKSRPGIFKRIINRVSRSVSSTKKTPADKATSEDNGHKFQLVRRSKNNKLFKDIPYIGLNDGLFDAIENRDAKFVSEVLEYHSNDAKEDAKELFAAALTHDETGYIIQLLVNKNLFETDGFESDLDYAISTSKQAGNIRKEKLLTGIKDKLDHSKLYADIPLTTFEKTTP